LAACLEAGEFLQFLDSLFDVAAADTRGAIDAETFATKAGHDAAVNHGAADVGVDAAAGRREEAHEPAHETVSCASGINHLAQRIGRTEEPAGGPGKNRPMRPFLDDDVFR